jgi:hypothetical protein
MRSEASHVAVPRYFMHVTDRVLPGYFLFPSVTTCQPFSSSSQDRFRGVSRRPCTQLSTGKYVDRARRQYSSFSGERTGESKCALFSPIRDSPVSPTTLPLSCSSHLLSPIIYRFALIYTLYLQVFFHRSCLILIEALSDHVTDSWLDWIGYHVSRRLEMASRSC